MKASPLQLEDSRITEISLRTGSNTSTAEVEVAVDVECDFKRHGKDRSRWMVRIHVKFGDIEVNDYAGEIRYTGIFQVTDESLSEEDHLRLVAINSPSILYSSAREVIALLTARGENGAFMLPSVSFVGQKLTGPVESVSKKGRERAIAKGAERVKS